VNSLWKRLWTCHKTDSVVVVVVVMVMVMKYIQHCLQYTETPIYL